jgi:hypothetical protein
MSDLHTNGTANRAPTGAQDDIIDRLSRDVALCWGCVEWGCADCFCDCHDWDGIHAAAKAEIGRLRRRVERFNIALADLEHLSTERAVLHRIKEARRA